MPYDRQSPAALLGQWAEAYVAARAKSHGWHVLHTAEVGDGATMVEGPDSNRVVMPDLQLFDLVRRRQSRLVEVKAKRGAYRWQRGQIDCTGIDADRWEHYLRINASGVPVDLALIHMRQPRRESPDIAPCLLWQTVSKLADSDPMTFEHDAFRGGGIVWDVRAFELLGFLPPPPDDILNAINAMGANLRKWEVPPGKGLRRPRDVPGQLALDF